MKKGYDHENGGKQFTAMNENGSCYSFEIRSDATLEDATKYAKLWNSLAGGKRIVKVWENRK